MRIRSKDAKWPSSENDQNGDEPSWRAQKRPAELRRLKGRVTNAVAPGKRDANSFSGERWPSSTATSRTLGIRRGDVRRGRRSKHKSAVASEARLRAFFSRNFHDVIRQRLRKVRLLTNLVWSLRVGLRVLLLSREIICSDRISWRPRLVTALAFLLGSAYGTPSGRNV